MVAFRRAAHLKGKTSNLGLFWCETAPVGQKNSGMLRLTIKTSFSNTSEWAVCADNPQVYTQQDFLNDIPISQQMFTDPTVKLFPFGIIRLSLFSSFLINSTASLLIKWRRWKKWWASAQTRIWLNRKTLKTSTQGFPPVNRQTHRPLFHHLRSIPQTVIPRIPLRQVNPSHKHHNKWRHRRWNRRWTRLKRSRRWPPWIE